jgi:dihydroxyacetone kinase DhaKLM complex PTS-EIIA-like component DhaM
MSHLPKSVSISQTKITNKGRIIMDIGSLRMVKENLVEVKETTIKVKKVTDNKQGCLKLNDYFAF